MVEWGRALWQRDVRAEPTTQRLPTLKTLGFRQKPLPDRGGNRAGPGWGPSRFVVGTRTGAAERGLPEPFAKARSRRAQWLARRAARSGLRAGAA